MNLGQAGVTVKGISPRVMWPSEASTCQRRRYVPAARPVASAESVSSGVCLLISSVCTEPSGWMSVKRERSVSMRTLNRSLIGTSGPVTALFRAGFDSRRIACAAAEGTPKKAPIEAIRMSAQKFGRAGCMTFLFAKKSEKLRKRSIFNCYRKIIQKLAWIANSFREDCPNRAVPPGCGEAKKIRRRDCSCGSSRLLLRADLVAVVPINRRIGRGIVGDFAGRWLVELALRTLFFLHFALFDALHFFLALLECCGHMPLLTAECGEGPGPCRPAHPWNRKTTTAARAAAALTHGNLRLRSGRVRRPCRVRRFLRPVRQNSVDPAAGRLRPSAPLHSPSTCAPPLFFPPGPSQPRAPLPLWA